jgi:hypothetical protein
MSNAPSNPGNLDQLDEQLVSYLDGELPPNEARQIEDLLARDGTARSRLNELASSWDMLDQLPRATVDELFTRTTVEMVALAAEDDAVQSQAALPARRSRRGYQIAIAVAAAAVIGFGAIFFFVPSENDILLRDLPVIANLEIYRDVDDIQQLKQFASATPKLFSDAAAARAARLGQSADPAAKTSPNFSSSVPVSLNDRRTWVEALSPADKVELRKSLERFIALPAKQQQALRQLDEQLASDPDGAELRRIAQRYYAWLKTLSSVDRANVLDEHSDQDQIKLIRQLRQMQLRQTFTWLDPGIHLLSDRDNAVLLQWMAEFAEKHSAELGVASPQQNPPGAKDSDNRRPRLPAAWWPAWQHWWAPLAKETPPITADDIQALREKLSPEKRKSLDGQTTLPDKIALVRQWVQDATAQFRDMAMQRAGRWGGLPNKDQLERFGQQQLSADEKKELEGLSSDDRMQKLVELFQKHRAADFQRFGPPNPKPSDSPPAGAPPGKSSPDDDSTEKK